MNKTSNYSLNQWERADRVLMEDFNADNAKIDAAVAAVAAKVSGKADSTALAALQTAVNAKADASALAALTQTVNGKGNCQIAAGSYTGTGTYGVSAQNKLTFSFKPLAVAIVCQEGTTLLISGAAQCVYHMGRAYALWNVTWSGNSVSWYIYQASNASQSSYRVNDETQMNASGVVYHYFAIGTADA